ncbi:hypothetical protein [Sphingomonas daechungensis]|uniref:hypothetical protein n=1 Tax=Sphingomonas daechungensis TaxID=1176646 RepID=UPI001CB9428A|nr:hypothetical protein [Sphingomonas daechungensis]
MRRSTIAICAALAMLIVIALVGSTLIRKHQPDLGTSQYGTGAAEKAIPAPSASPPDDGNWTMPGKDYASTRFSGLSQVTLRT